MNYFNSHWRPLLLRCLLQPPREQVPLMKTVLRVLCQQFLTCLKLSKNLFSITWYNKISYISCYMPLIQHLNRSKKKSIALRGSSFKERRSKLKLLLKKLFRYGGGGALVALSKDLGKSKTEALLAEIYGVKAEATFAIKNIKSWMKTKRVAGKSTCNIIYQKLG